MATHVRGYFVGIVPGPPFSPERRRKVEALTVQVGLARNSLDVNLIEPLLATAVKYQSQDITTALSGKDQVVDYLRERWPTIRKIAPDGDTGRMVLGSVDLPEATDHPCLIFEVGGQRQGLWALKVDEQGLVARIDILTVAPPPSAAVKVGDL